VHRRPHVGCRRSSRIGNLKTIKNQFAVIVGVTLVLGLARVGARAEDTNLSGTIAPGPKLDRPERPSRPDKPGVNTAELKQIIKNFQDQKKEFLRQQKEQQREGRGKVRQEITSDSSTVGEVRRELNDSINDAKRQAREQARKLADEAKEAAKEHKRD
jgi:hypothetical protein